MDTKSETTRMTEDDINKIETLIGFLEYLNGLVLNPTTDVIFQTKADLALKVTERKTIDGVDYRKRKGMWEYYDKADGQWFKSKTME